MTIRQKAWNKGVPCREETKAKLRAVKKPKGYTRSLDIRKKIREGLSGKPKSEEHKRKLSEAALNRILSKETRSKMSKTHKANYASGRVIPPWLGKKHSDEYKRKMSEKKRGISRPKEVIRKILRSMKVTPNKQEQALGKLIREALHTREYCFNAKRARVILDGCIPDFVNVNGQKKAIELFGGYWHSPTRKGIKYNQTYEGRINTLKKLGWECLIVYQHELKHPDTVIEKIREFNRVG